MLLIYERHDPGHLRCHHRTIEVEVPLWKLKVDPDISVERGLTLNDNARGEVSGFRIPLKHG